MNARVVCQFGIVTLFYLIVASVYSTTLHAANLANDRTLIDDTLVNSPADGPINRLWDGCTSESTSACLTSSGQADSFSATFDLGSVTALESARLFADGDGDWLTSSWSLQHRESASDTWTSLTGPMGDGSTGWKNLSLGVDARFVRLHVSGPGNSKLQVREFELLGASPAPTVPPRSVATESNVVDTSNNFRTNRGAANLFDGCYGDQDVTCMTGNINESSFWIDLDLLEPHRVSEVRLHGDTIGTWVSTRWHLEYKLDEAGEWQTAFFNRDAYGNNWFRVPVDFSAQFLRVTVIGDTEINRTQARELEVIAVPESDVNAASIEDSTDTSVADTAMDTGSSNNRSVFAFLGDAWQTGTHIITNAVNNLLSTFVVPSAEGVIFHDTFDEDSRAGADVPNPVLGLGYTTNYPTGHPLSQWTKWDALPDDDPKQGFWVIPPGEGWMVQAGRSARSVLFANTPVPKNTLFYDIQFDQWVADNDYIGYIINAQTQSLACNGFDCTSSGVEFGYTRQTPGTDDTTDEGYVSGDLGERVVAGIGEPHFYNWRSHRIEVRGTSVSWYIDNELIMSGNVPDMQSGGYFGIRQQYDRNTRYDNVLITQVDPPPGFFANLVSGGSGGPGAPINRNIVQSGPGGAADFPTPNGFVHPGILNNIEELEYIKQQVDARNEPWYSDFQRLKNDRRSSAAYRSGAFPVCNVGYYQQCDPHMDDARAVYQLALMWYMTGDSAYAERSMHVLDDWSRTLTAIGCGTNGCNAFLQAGWTGTLYARGAEILKHTYSGWDVGVESRFKSMLTNVYLPWLDRNGDNITNWETSSIESTLAVAIFMDDTALWSRGVARLNRKLDRMIRSDGVGVETCRDTEHQQYGLGDLANIAEILYKQGYDVYSSLDNRILKGYQHHAQLMLDKPNSDPIEGCTIDYNGKWDNPVHASGWELVYNHYKHRMGVDVGRVEQVIQQYRTRPYRQYYHWIYTVLTHGDLNKSGSVSNTGTVSSSDSADSGVTSGGAPNSGGKGIVFEDQFEGNVSSDWTSIQTCCSHSRSIVSSPARTGNGAIKFEHRKGDRVSGGERSELSNPEETHAQNGDEFWYGFSTYIPSNWVNETGGWDMIAQWHGNPQTREGEEFRIATAHLTIVGDQFMFYNIWDADSITDKSTYRENARNWKTPLVKGRWVDWVVHAKWSYGNDGVLEVWKDGVKIVDDRGPNNYNDPWGPYFKLGIYRGSNTNWSNVNTRVAYHDAVKIGGSSASYNDVAP